MGSQDAGDIELKARRSLSGGALDVLFPHFIIINSVIDQTANHS
jgi:hypothetical protein